MFWFIVSWVVSAVLAFVLMPKPANVKPAGFNDIQVPTSEEGREIPVLFGTRVMDGPNVVWSGDFRAVAVKKSGGKK